jgi:hypothetical protein
MNGNDGTDNLKTIPLQDDKIDQALLELDAKLDAWAQMILSTQASLKNLASSVETQEPDKDAGDNDYAIDSVEVTSNETNVEIQPATIEAQPEAAVPEDSHSENESPLDVDDVKEPESASMLEPAVAAEPRELEESNKEDDEALLATLEPEMVKKIQMLRRLTSKKRSIRELIEQVKASSSGESAPATTKKKSFWRL